MDKRYTIRIRDKEYKAVGGGLYEAVTIILKTYFNQNTYQLEMEQWPNDPNHYTLAQQGRRVGEFEVVKVEG